MADNGGEKHDLEKLVKWCDSLSQEVSNPLDVYAMFLISPEAEAAQDVFRRFRSSFEARQAPLPPAHPVRPPRCLSYGAGTVPRAYSRCKQPPCPGAVVSPSATDVLVLP